MSFDLLLVPPQTIVIVLVSLNSCSFKLTSLILLLLSDFVLPFANCSAMHSELHYMEAGL